MEEDKNLEQNLDKSNEKLHISDVINSAKIKVTVAGIGTVDKCDHCETEFTTGAACWKVDKWKSLNLCHICLKKYYEEI
jgi:hypothetical protein